MVCGSYDGLIELYDFETGLVDKRLDYQSRVRGTSAIPPKCCMLESVFVLLLFRMSS